MVLKFKDEIVADKVSIIEAYNNEFHHLLAQDMDKALAQCQEIKTLCESIGYRKGVLDAELNQGWYHLWRCEFEHAFPLFKDLPEQYKAIGDDFGYLKSVNSLGAIHMDMGNYDSALPYFFNSLKLARNKNEKEREASVLANLGLLYDAMDRIEEAYDHFSEALNIPELNDTGFYTASKCIALYNIKKQEWKIAASYLEKAINMARKKKNYHFESELLVTRGTLYQNQNMNQAAEACFTQGLEISRKLGNKKIETEHLYELGCLALEEKKSELATTYFDQVMAMAEKKELGGLICKSYKKLSDVYEHKKDYRNALAYLKKFNKVEKDYDLKKAELKLQSLSFEHDLEKKQQQAEIYQLKNIELEKANQKILQLANHDNLTGLPNRRLFMEHLSAATKTADRHGTKIALLFIDLDNFKPVNDQFGHIAGDRLLKDVSERLSGGLRKSDMVARFGGDEFVILIPDLCSSDDLQATGGKIIELMQEKFIVGGGMHQLGTSVGISIYPDHGRDVDDLLAKADIAMYTAKVSGKNAYVMCDC